MISLPTTYSGLDMTLKQMAPGKAQQLISLFRAGDRQGTEALRGRPAHAELCVRLVRNAGMHITGTRTPFDFLIAIAQHSLEGILHNVKQDILLTEGEQDHLFNVDWIYRAMRELVCARSVTARGSSPRARAPSNIARCGNSALARDEIVRWLVPVLPGDVQWSTS